jgi:regulator of sigma E protease
MMHIFGLTITWFQAIAAVAGIGILVFIHELGHFIMAKYFKLKVEQFAFGFGPEIAGFTYGETRYSLNAIPLGGMVKMPGENADNATGSPDEFLSQAWYKRFLIAFSGPFMNYLLAVILFTVVLTVWGIQRPSSKPVIGDVLPGYPAAAAGIKPGDLVTRVDALPVDAWEDMSDYIHRFPGKPVAFTLQRSGVETLVTITPAKDAASGMGLIGIAPSVETEKIGLGEAAYASVRMVVYQSVFTLKYLGIKIVRWEKPDLAGPIGVVQILAKAADAGWQALLHLLAVISVALGLFNLLPIPLVDGGHMVLSVIEAVFRRPISKKAIIISNYAGLGIILAVFLFATYSDILRIIAK